VYSINQQTGEPTLIQSADGHSNQMRTFGIDPSGRVLITASTSPIPVREGSNISTLPARICVFRLADDGKLTFARSYDVDATAQKQQFWAGLITLA